MNRWPQDGYRTPSAPATRSSPQAWESQGCSSGQGRGTDGSVHHLQPSSKEAVSVAHPSFSHQSSHSFVKARASSKAWCGILHTRGHCYLFLQGPQAPVETGASPSLGCLPDFDSKGESSGMRADLPLYSSSRGRRMAIHLCSMPQSLMENLRRECANRHCEQAGPRHCVARLAGHHAASQSRPSASQGL